MRIIGGEAKSRRIDAPKGTQTRPTLDKTKESLFNILQFHLEGKKVLDLYAGSGALALESISRGANSAVLCDNSREAQKTIVQNINALGYEGQTKVLPMADMRALQLLHAQKEAFDIIFLDPPYALSVAEALQKIAEYQLLLEDGIIIVEHTKEQTPLCPPQLTIFDSRKYRETVLTFIKKQGD